MGIITGCVGPEVDIALEMMQAHAGERWWDVVISADICPKPDPRALQLAIQGIEGGVGGGLYIGDTGDDLDPVVNYPAIKNASEPDMLAAILVDEHDALTSHEPAADFIF